jgi:hypothetical protein
MYVKSAFLNGKINELVYVEQPPDFEDSKKPNHVYKLSKVLYGLKQVGKMDTTLFTKKNENDLFICQIYVDDIIFGSTNQEFCEEFGDMISREFKMSMIDELSFFLGLQVKKTKDGIFIYQSKYVNDLLKRFGMDNSKSIKTLIAMNAHLDLDEGGKLVYLKLYRSMISSLLYLTIFMPDIVFSICMCARFQASPKECHMMDVQQILRYLRQTPNLGIWYPKGAHFILIGYSDSDYASCKIDRNSTLGTCQLLGRSLVLWLSKKQNIIAFHRRSRICFHR